MTLLSEVLPEYDFRERHTIAIDAPPERVYAAAKEVTLAEMPVARTLMRLRGMSARAERPVLEEALREFEVLAEEPNREIVIGAIGQPWKPRGGETPRADFRTFAEPGYAKMALSFRVDGGTLSTETRVLLTDDDARRQFRRYWLVIRPFSGLIRRIWLRAIKRRAEATS